MNVDEKELQEMQPSPLPSPTPSREERSGAQNARGEGENKEERPARLHYVPNRHDRRRAASEARKEANRKGKK